MKIIKCLFYLSLFISCHIVFSQVYFGNIENISLYQSSNSSGVYFGMESINSDFLDIAMVQSEPVYGIGQWNQNYGNGTFGNSSLFINNSIANQYKGSMFIKLHSGPYVKDYVVCRDEGLQVHWNQNGGIGGIQQNFTNAGSNWIFFEPGVFNASDNTEDLLAGNGLSSTIYYFTNNNDGYFQNPGNVTLPNNNVSNFKLKQLNEKTTGYVQYYNSDRADIIFLDKSNEDEGTHEQIYAFLNNNNNGFQTSQPFADFDTDCNGVSDLEIADIDGDGYNDLIAICNDGTCPTHYYIRVYKNAHGQYFNGDCLVWSYTLNTTEISCGAVPKVSVADINKDGYNDLVFVLKKGEEIPGIRVMAFINHYPNSYFTTGTPEQTIDIGTNENDPTIVQAMTADIYGGQSHDGGGIALIISYYDSPQGTANELHVKIVNASTSLQQSSPPPPIVEKFLEYDHDNIWHPHIHLNNRGERDFNHFEIWKFKSGWAVEQIIGNTPDTGWTDYGECVDATGYDNFYWNCYYFAKTVEKPLPTSKVSISSKILYYSVDCIPICDGCSGEDNPITQQNQNNFNEKILISNYPNPFNPITNIRLYLPKTEEIKIIIYNCIGQEIQELINGYYEKGLHVIEFNGVNFSSGIYFYRIITQGFSQTNKMLLLK